MPRGSRNGERGSQNEQAETPHRHAGSPTADITISAEPGRVRVEVIDQGQGIVEHKPAGTRVGVGIRGMRERVSQLGGALQVSSSTNGTQVTAILPLKDSTSEETESVSLRNPRLDCEFAQG